MTEDEIIIRIRQQRYELREQGFLEEKMTTKIYLNDDDFNKLLAATASRINILYDEKEKYKYMGHDIEHTDGKSYVITGICYY